MSLVSRKYSGKSRSLADQFHFICEREDYVNCLLLYQQYQFANLPKQLLLLLMPFQPWNYYQIKRLSLISCWRQVVYTFAVKYFTHNLKYWLLLITESHFLSWTRWNKGEVNKGALTHLHDLLLAFLVLKWSGKQVICRICDKTAERFHSQFGKEYGFKDHTVTKREQLICHFFPGKKLASKLQKT